MIEEHTGIHDLYQLESKIEYNFSQHQDSVYYMDAYWFIPNSLDINPLTYSSSDFFKDMQNYTRFKTPDFSADELSDSIESPIYKIKNLLEKSTLITDSVCKSIIHQIKIGCNCFRSIMKKHLDSFHINNIENTEQISSILISIKNSLKAFRNLLNKTSNMHLSNQLDTVALCADEFISIEFEHFLLKMSAYLKQSTNFSDNDFIDILHQTVRSEIKYRKKNNYTVINDSLINNEENEALVHRLSIYKKFYSSALFLGSKQVTEGKFVEQILIGFAAGLAMVFATVIAFYFQRRFGNLTFPFFIALVISYIFKDRIKELTRLFLINTIMSSFYDHKTTLYTQSGTKIGVIKESMNFVKEKALPEEIGNLRNKDHVTEVANFWREENILHYRKKVILKTRKISSILHTEKIKALKEISRFNISRFLKKMDNPLKHILVLRNNEISKVSSKRIYKINLISKFSEGNNIEFKRYRIILNRDGLKRIEFIDINK